MLRPSPRRRLVERSPRFESVEPRLVMSVNPIGDVDISMPVETQAFVAPLTSVGADDDLTGLIAAREEFGFSGQGQTVVIIDSGIAYDHLALGGGLGTDYRVVGGYDFTDARDNDPRDDGPAGGHGTHVAGIIASDDDSNLGVAPGVDLVSLRVFNDTGQSDLTWVEEALLWTHRNRNAFENPITTVVLSVGRDWNSSDLPGWATLEDELARLEADGMFVSVAAGNDFADNQTPGLSYPAVSPYVVPVSSFDPSGRLSYFSQRDDRIIAAPGRSVLSTVPDYLGDGNGIDDDYIRLSGTSMAAPYVAGASVLLREAYEFVGVQNVTRETLYTLMRNTADQVHDTVTGQSYRRLNVYRALDTIMSADDFGSRAAAAYDLGRLDDSLSINGAIERVADRDYFAFTAGQTGSVTLAANANRELLPDWELAGRGSSSIDRDGKLAFDVQAGKTYTVGLGTSDGVGQYSLDIALSSEFSVPDENTVRQLEYENVAVSAAGQWFEFTAGQQGILTVEAFFANRQGDVDLELFDADQQFLGGSYGISNSERIDVTVAAGQTVQLHAFTAGAGTNGSVDLRLTNLVTQTGDTVAVFGTDGNDRFEFAAGSTHQVTVNGVEYAFDADAVDTFRFDGLSGWDTMIARGTRYRETAVLRVGSVELVGSGYRMEATRVERVTAFGGGGRDTASLYDSAGNDTLVAKPDVVTLTGSGFSQRVVGFRTVHAYAKAGGVDRARLYDSAGDDTFVGRPTLSKLFGDGYFRRVKFFDNVVVYATAGGYDDASFFDSAGNDSFLATPTYAVMSGTGFRYRAENFDQVHGYAKAGGFDSATMIDSDGNDRLVRHSNYTKLRGDDFLIRAKFFEEVDVRATAGGYDRVTLFDTALDDQLTAAGDSGQIANAVLSTWFSGFDDVVAFSTSGGSDTTEIAAVDYLLEIRGRWD